MHHNKIGAGLSEMGQFRPVGRLNRNRRQIRSRPGPVNCATAPGDIAMLQKEKVSAAQQAAAGVSTIAPVGAVAGFLTGTEGEKAQVTTGDYNKALDQAITRIKSTCGIA